jgi:hypothetical protein
MDSPIPEADSTTAIATANEDLAPAVDAWDFEMVDSDEDPTSPDDTPDPETVDSNDPAALYDQIPDLADESDDEENDEQGNKPVVQQIISFEEAMEIIKARLNEKK